MTNVLKTEGFAMHAVHLFDAELGHKMGSLRDALRVRFYAPIQGS